MDIFGVAVLVFLVTDPFGNIAIYLAALKNVAPERRMRVALRELLLALALLMLFLTFGDTILSGLGLSRESTAIAGGIILFVIAMRLIFPRPEGVLGDLPEDARELCAALGTCAIAEIIGRTDAELFTEVDARRFQALDDKVYSSGERHAGEELFPDAQGRLRHYWSIKLMQRMGDQACLIGFSTDITELKEAEQALARS